MSDFLKAARDLIRARDGEGGLEGFALAATEFVEVVTFADPDVIHEGLRTVLDEDWMGLPVWARNIAFRLACLQRPEDPGLFRAAAVDLEAFGPDWDGIAAELNKQADDLDPSM